MSLFQRRILAHLAGLLLYMISYLDQGPLLMNVSCYLEN